MPADVFFGIKVNDAARFAEYSEARALRQQSAATTALVVEGV